MAALKQETKQVTRRYAILKKDFTYAYYTTKTIEAGTKFRVGGPHGYRLYREGLAFTLGHGASEMIPMELLELVEETDEVVTTITCRSNPWVPEWREPAPRSRAAHKTA